jgi:hypothetical protein
VVYETANTAGEASKLVLDAIRYGHAAIAYRCDVRVAA